MPHIAVLVGMAVHDHATRLPEGPDPEGDQHDSHQHLRPCGEPVEVESLTDQLRHDAEEHHPRSVPESPGGTDPPGGAGSFHTERGKRREVIGSTEYVGHSGNEPRDGGQHQVARWILSRRPEVA